MKIFLKLNQIEQYISLLEENAIISKTDTEGVIKFANQRFCDISGYSEAELVGKNHRVVNSGIHPKSFFTQMWSTISSGKIWVGEICNRAKNNNLYWVSSTIVPIFDKQGKIEQYISIRHEITEKKLLDEQLFRLRRLESVGRMTSGIAHDFNNILTIMLGHIEVANFLAEELPAKEGQEILDNLQEATKAGWRSAELIKKMLMYCRQESNLNAKLPLVNLENAIFEALKMIKSIMAGVVIKTEIEKPIFIHTDETELTQMLLNLCVNACDAMNHKGVLTVALDFHESKSSCYCSACAEPFAGQFARITIQDDGEGIDEKIMSRIFDPFFTTKDVHKGTGLGLSVVSGLVHKFSGHITVESKKGVGTRFSILLPIMQ